MAAYRERYLLGNWNTTLPETLSAPSEITGRRPPLCGNGYLSRAAPLANNAADWPPLRDLA
ncbi:MAG: hypothetical protein OXC14_10020 [Rhodospirillaceae bacterium]|nr:hypothetical protein [Rhodospirillaceae bacterium]